MSRLPRLWWGSTGSSGRRRRMSPLKTAAVAAFAAVAAVAAMLVPGTYHAQSAHAATCANPIVCENELPGTPQSVWDVGPGEGTTIQGFADPFSVNVGGSVNFKIESPASSYNVDIYRMGYYGGDGARLVASITPNIAVSQSQPACDTNTTTGLVDCGNWGVSATWNVPTTAVSGVYFAHIYRTDGTSDENQIPFVVTNNASTSDIVFMTSDETWEAYNDWGGYSLYTGDATGSPWCCSELDPGRAVQVSYNRPFATRFDTPNGQDFFFYAEFPMIEFLEENGYNVSYVSQSDVAAPGAASMLEQHKVFMAAGHSEYWDAQSRANVTAAMQAGVNLAFFTGNTMWWKTRWLPSSITGENYQTLVTYKESLDSAQTDPSDPPTWTGAWRDPRFSPPADGGDPENALTGQLWMVNCCSYSDQVPYQYSQLPIWDNTAVASLQPGQTYTMPDQTLGYEWDSDVDNGFRPPGEIDMSQTCEDVSQLLLTVNEIIGPGEACNSLTLYRASSGALVFDAGTVQWAWGLNSNHDGDANPAADPNMQQATVNLLAMMGVQPATLMSGLVPGSATTDTTPPTSTITSPAAGSTIANGSTVTISGTATDSTGSVVAGVEVSTDGGSTWHPVTTMSPDAASVTWSYTWSAAGSGPVTILSRATDGSGYTETPGPGIGVTVNCPCGLFGANYVPTTTSTDDPTAYELGMKFQSTIPGWVAGVRFYKGAGNNGTHTGSLWTSSGTLLATGTFTNETASGWQTLLFANPVQITANTTYVVGYYDPDGYYASELDKFDWQLSTPPLIAPNSNYMVSGGGNGVYNVGGPGFPTLSHAGTSYAVDVIFDTSQPPGAPPAVASATPAANSSSNPVSTALTATFSKQIAPNTAVFTVVDPNGNQVAGTTTLDPTGTIATFTPSAPLESGTTYTVTISGAQDMWGQPMTSYSYVFTTSQVFSAGCPCAIWPDTPPSSVSDATDKNSVELGVKFVPSLNGDITAVRFYKLPDNTGTHTGTLWSSTGTILATGTFSNESSQGWEQLNFSSPVAVNAGTTYVASYHTSAGHYSVTSGGLSSAVTSGPLTVPANGGVYTYGASTVFPTSTYNGSNYWVDVVFANPSQPPPAVSSTTPSGGATSVPVSTSVTVTLNQQVTSGSPVFTLTDLSGNSIQGTSSLNSAGTTLTFTPASPLNAATTYVASISGAVNSYGIGMPSPYTWTFTTSGVSACPCSLFESDAVPATITANDKNSVNVGIKFTSAVAGTITGIRFYKGPNNTGTHVGSLWSSTGTLLAQVTFTNETASGWQTATFATPVPIAAGTTYVASYLAPKGEYSVTSAAFSAAAWLNYPLEAPQSTSTSGNGVYTYSSSSVFPTSTYNATNYWVDVIFTPSSS
jgi:methionine-rich copper-binding protein CopC